MALYVDHVFITCDFGAPEADALVSRGFTEGSANVHKGQGTANRRFFFANCMLELLWVADPTEAAGDAVRGTRLGERWSRRATGASRFGIVYGGVPAQGSSPPFTTESYRPSYLPASMTIEIVQGMSLEEPALFWIPSLGEGPVKRREPMNHKVPVQNISGVAIGLAQMSTLSHAARRVRDAALLELFEATSPVLELRFRSEQEMSIDCRPDLPLVFRGAPE